MTEDDEAAVRWQLGRAPRGLLSVAYRCPCGDPAVVVTAPLLPDGSPFPTTFYATCPRLNAAIGRLESSGAMRVMERRLHEDPELADAYRQAHLDYLEARGRLGGAPDLEGVSAGGMPDRVKCLHALAAHALASGPGVNPFGDEALEEIGRWWESSPCTGRDAGP